MNDDTLTSEQEILLWDSLISATQIVYPTLFERKSDMNDSTDIDSLLHQIDS